MQSIDFLITSKDIAGLPSQIKGPNFQSRRGIKRPPQWNSMDLALGGRMEKNQGMEGEENWF
jgi:hypothetical protein